MIDDIKRHTLYRLLSFLETVRGDVRLIDFTVDSSRFSVCPYRLFFFTGLLIFHSKDRNLSNVKTFLSPPVSQTLVIYV